MPRSYGRVRKVDDQRFNINNVKKGAEKRAHDDFVNSMMSKAGVNLNQGVGKDVAGIGSSVNKMTRELVNGNINEIKHAVIKSTSNEERSNTVMNFMGVSKLGLVMLSNAGVNIQNKETMREIIDLEDSVFNKTNMEKLNQTLLSNKVIQAEEKLSINKNNIYKSFKQIESKIDVFTSERKLNPKSEKVIGDISRRSTDDLIILLKKAKKASDNDLVNVIETQIGINELIKRKSPLVRRHSRISGYARRIVNMNVNNEGLRGFNTVMQYKAMTQMLVKGTHIYYKGVAKGVIKSGDFLLRGSAFALEKHGFIIQSQAISHGRNVVIAADKHMKETLHNYKVQVRNTARKAPGTAKHAVAEKGRSIGRMTVKGTRFVSSRVKSTSAYSQASGMTKRAYTGIVQSRAGRITTGVARTGKKVTKKVVPKMRKVGQIIIKPAKIAKGILTSALKGLNVISLFVKKIAIIVAVAIGGLAIATTGFVAIIGGVMVIGDAITITYEEFTQKTAMGKAYNSLIAKERLFFETVSTIYLTTPVPPNEEGYAIQGILNYGEQRSITAFSGETISVVDGNGVELFGNDRYNTKAILALAAVYIDQDFTRYSGVAGLFGGVYQDYCNRLYKNSHSSFIEPPSQSDVYYCGDDDSTYGGHKAASDCNNLVHISHGYWTSDSANPPECEHYTSREHAGDEFSSGYTSYKCDGHDYCAGHINAKVHVVVSGAYQPEDYDAIDMPDDMETNNNLYDVDAYGTAYMYEDASDTLLGNVASIATNVGNSLFLQPLSLLDINLGDEIVDGVMGITVYHTFKDKKQDDEGNDFKFKSYLGSPNKNFAGWNTDNRNRAKILLAGDWNELYHIDFETDLSGIEFDFGFYEPAYELGNYLGGDVGIPILNYFNQGNYPNHPIKSGCPRTIATSGCGFVSLAMVANTLTNDNKYTPTYVVNQLGNDYYVCDKGGSHLLPTTGAARFGLRGEQISMSVTKFAEVIDDGGLIIALIGSPYPATEFYGGNGHFIVIRGVTESGKIVVADPGKASNNSKAWPISQLRLRKAWAIYND